MYNSFNNLKRTNFQRFHHKKQKQKTQSKNFQEINTTKTINTLKYKYNSFFQKKKSSLELGINNRFTI